jgi:glucuronokinase
VHERWKAGDPSILAAVAELARIADEGCLALESGATDELRRLVDRNFAVRASLYDIRPRDQRMIEIGRERGAATKFCGSGGSVLAVPADPEGAESLRRAYRDAGFQSLVPSIAPAL